MMVMMTMMMLMMLMMMLLLLLPYGVDNDMLLEPFLMSCWGMLLEQPRGPYTPSATLWGIFSELLGRVGSSECQDELQELVWAH